jgi:hypothetical protein
MASIFHMQPRHVMKTFRHPLTHAVTLALLLASPAMANDLDAASRTQREASSVDSDTIVSGLVNDRLQAGVDKIGASKLPFLGKLQGGITYDNALGKIAYDLLAIDALYGNGEVGHNLLGQVGVHNQADRPTANLGVVYRWINAEQALMLGGNVFYDHDFKRGAKRFGAGVEAVTGNARAFSNVYAPLGDAWTVSPKDDEREERPARGFDLGLAYTPSLLPVLDLQLSGARWQGDAVDVFGGGKTERDPTVVSAKVAYTPVPLITAGLEHARSTGGQRDTSASLRFNYQFGVPMSEQLTSKASAQRNSIAFRALAPVEREQRIVMETRDRYAAPPMFAGATLVREEILEGRDYVAALAVTGGTALLHYTLSGADANVFVLSGNQLQLSARDFGAPADADGDNVYEVTVTVTDSRGRSAQKQFQVVVVEDATQTPGNIAKVSVHLDGAPLRGRPIVGQVLSVHLACEGDCVSDATYQWERETTQGSGIYEAIPGANATTYTATREDQRRAIRVKAWHQ